MADPLCEPVRSLRDDLLLSGVADKVLVLDPTGARVHVLNSSAAWVWSLIDGDRAIEDIAAVITSASGLDHATIRNDVVTVIEHFQSVGLLADAPPLDDADRPARDRRDDADLLDHDPLDPLDPLIGNGDGAHVDDRPGAAVHRIGPFRAIGLTVAIRSDCETIATELDGLLRELACDAAPDGTYVVVTHDEGPRYRAHLGPVAIASSDEAQGIVDGILVDLNRRAIERADGWLLFHAGAVELDGSVIALPGASGHGKSTLTAALVSGGAGYLTDEATVVDPTTFLVEPYPKPLALTDASVEAVRLPGTAPAASIVPDPAKSHMAPTAFGSPRSAASPLGALVFPRYVPEAATELVPLDIEDALLALVPCTFAPTWAVPGALDRLVDLVESVPAFHLTFSDLQAAVALVRDAVTIGSPR